MKELIDYPPLMTLQQAADFFQVTPQTVVKYGKERRIIIIGTRNGQRVRRASILDYLEERSEWHARQSETPDASPALARSATKKAAPSRGRPSGHMTTAGMNIVDFNGARRLRRG